MESTQYLRHFLDNCTITVLDACLTHCWNGWHELNYIPSYNKFYFILSGEGELTVDGKAYYPKSGELFLMPAGIKQSYRAVNNNPYTKYWCHFTAESGGIRLFDAIKTPLCIQCKSPEKLAALFEELISSRENSSAAAPLPEKAAMFKILAVFLEGAHLNEADCKDNLPAEHIQRISDYITSHLDKEITLDELAALAHLHPNYFIGFFHKYFGMTPLRYVSKIRIERAKLLLKTTSDSISDIAEQTGFREPGHFSKRFKACTGFSPSDFRKL